MPAPLAARAARAAPQTSSTPCLFSQRLSKPESHKSGFILINICFAPCFDLFQNPVQHGAGVACPRPPARDGGPSWRWVPWLTGAFCFDPGQMPSPGPGWPLSPRGPGVDGTCPPIYPRSRFPDTGLCGAGVPGLLVGGTWGDTSSPRGDRRWASGPWAWIEAVVVGSAHRGGQRARGGNSGLSRARPGRRWGGVGRRPQTRPADRPSGAGRAWELVSHGGRP